MLPMKFLGGDFWSVISAVGTGLGALFAAAAVLVALGQLIYPVWSERKRRRFLTKKLHQGPFDARTIEHATRYYIRPKCSNIDPGQEKEIRHALVATRENLF